MSYLSLGHFKFKIIMLWTGIWNHLTNDLKCNTSTVNWSINLNKRSIGYTAHLRNKQQIGLTKKNDRWWSPFTEWNGSLFVQNMFYANFALIYLPDIFFWKKSWCFNWTNLNSLYFALCQVWFIIWSSSFSLICHCLRWKKTESFIWINWNSFKPRVLCAKFIKTGKYHFI